MKKSVNGFMIRSIYPFSHAFNPGILILSIILAFGMTLSFFNPVYAAEKQKKSFEALKAGFENPPASAQPRAFWWWHQGQVTLDGVKRDLEEMRDKGIGGGIITDAWAGNRMISEKTDFKPVFADREWRVLYRYALKKADSLGLELSLHIQSGWNHGAPFVTPKMAMKKIVWSETRVAGPDHISAVLPRSADIKKGFYRDIAVQAFKVAKKQESRPAIKNWPLKSVNDQFRGGGNYPLYLLRQQHPAVSGEADVRSKAIIDLSARTDSDGRLIWDVPEGEWVVLRFGYTLTGAHVQANNAGWDGLSIDHLDSGPLEFYFNTVVDTLLADAGDLLGKS
ncbi:hypothetical protein GF407_00355, partial [candidate division KSB1 bacterium]|nr:hypothetical protein [candidate division KSB1 bacterium]